MKTPPLALCALLSLPLPLVAADYTAVVPKLEEVTHHRVLVHSSGFRMSPYADVKPPGDAAKDVARKLWHRSPGSPG